MPNAQLVKLARRFKVSKETAERAWSECKHGIKPGEGGKGYGLVYDCTVKKLRTLKRKK